MRARYSNSLESFLNADIESISGTLADKNGTITTDEQKQAWRWQLEIMRREMGALKGGGGHVYLEFVIPRMGKRADAVIVYGGMIFVLEFKSGEKQNERADREQCMNYALDLKNFHEGSHDKFILPVLVADWAGKTDDVIGEPYKDCVFETVCTDGSNLGMIISETAKRYGNSMYVDPHE